MSRRKISGVIVFPGAGSDRDHSSLVALEKALKPLKVIRADFPYRKAGRKAPDRAPILMQAVRDEVERAARRWKVPTSQIVIGGRSMGGRMCSMVVADADDPVDVAGLILISYPLHPPGKPDNLRTEHLPGVKIPTLVISGTKDTFGTPQELKKWMKKIKGPLTWNLLEGKGHDLKGCDDAISTGVQGWLSSI